MYIQAKSGQLDEQWKLIICPLKPSQINLDGKNFSASFAVSRYGKRKVFSRGSTVTERLRSTRMSTVDLPEGGMPNNQYWKFSRRQVHGLLVVFFYCMSGNILTDGTVCFSHQCINEDGSCCLMLTLQTPELSQFKW